MEPEWIAIGWQEVAGIALAFALGLASRFVGLPPLVGFLGAGFLLNAYGVTDDELVPRLADMGITLLLFTVGLKLNVRTLVRPQVWAVAGLHMAAVVVVFGIALFVVSLSGLPAFFGMSMASAALIAFALSFSSTVFVVKVLEERGEMASFHGRISVGILLMQDVAAVAFLAVSVGQVPTIWTLGLLALWPARHLLTGVLARIGHGELLVLFGFLLALSGAEIFELVGLKGDLGALVFGLLVAGHPKSEELAKTMLNFKDLFLIGFFVSIGLSHPATLGAVVTGIALVPLVFLKSALYFLLFSKFRLRARTSLRAAVNLANFSEFGLIVAAIGVSNGWIQSDWLVILAVALSLSLAIAAGLSRIAEDLYARHRPVWLGFQSRDLLMDDRLFDFHGAKAIVIGMGGVGTGAYDSLTTIFGRDVVGVDIDSITAGKQRELGRNVIRGDPADADFWDRVEAAHSFELVMLALPRQSTTLAILSRLVEHGFKGHIAAIARFPDEAEALKEAGAGAVFNMYSEAGAGFVSHTLRELPIAQTGGTP